MSSPESKGEKQPRCAAGSGDLLVDPIGRCVTHKGTHHPLSDRQVRLLQAFAEANGALLTPEQLLTHVYRWGERVQVKTIRTHIQRLRAMLGAECIETVPGKGYRSAWIRAHPGQGPSA
jgi:DNA-binding response OmpR family regulator